MKTKIKPADTAFSLCVRERADWCCECCGKQYPRGGVDAIGLHCSHFYGRANRTVRWCGDNAAAHCFSCHQRLGSNPVDFSAWILNHLGEPLHEILTEKKNARMKISKIEEKEIAKYYREQLKIMLSLRGDGATGYLDFISYQ